MKNKNKGFYNYLFIYVWVILYALPVHAILENSPYVASGSCAAVQEEVLAFAKKAYDSTVFNLSDYHALEKAFADIETNSLDAVLLSEDFLEKKEALVSERSIKFSWPKQMVENQYTFVRTRQPFNWQGDWYALYWVPTSDLSHMINEEKEILKEDGTIPYKVLEKNLWQTPFFIYVKNKNDVVGVIPNQLYAPMSAWSLYVPAKNGDLSQCQIQFHPKTEELNVGPHKNQVLHVASQLFPRKGPFCSLIKVLNDILGPGTDEGTLNQTAGIRNHISHLIVNLALRPWVIESMDKGPSIKEKAHVDKNLEKWALKNNSFLKQHQSMKHLYPLAEKELKDYYQLRFGKNEEQADSLAKESLEMLYTSFFHFPSA